MASATSIRGGVAAAQPVGPITIDSPLGAEIAFRSADGVEGLSQLFRYEVVVVSRRPDLRGRDLLGQSVTVHLQRDANDSVRHFNGQVASFEYLTTGDDDLSRYRIVLRPWLWQLTKTADCRIFQYKSAPEIVSSVFRDHGFDAFDNKLLETYARREYVVQYRETDFHFVSRLMEQEGIYYFFRHVDGRHTMVLADSPSAHEATPGCEKIPFAPPDAHREATTQYVHRWRSQTEIETAKFAHADYEFRRPRMRLYALREAPDLDAADSLEVYDYPGDFTTSADATRYANLRLAQIRAGTEVSAGETNDRGLTVGSTFTLTDHPRDEENKEYIVVSAQCRLRGHEIRSGGQAEEDAFVSEFGVIDAKKTFRAAVRTRKPVVQGPQTAVVVGPAGQEIWTDEYGRIKVQFHWDRLGQRDENSSCFVRVAQSWAGGGWGAQFIPRIGQEVVVDFLEGDPDRPIVTGSVYNGANMPPFSLPENATQSGVRTRSTKGGAIPNANEIRFEDRKGAEELYLQAEKDMNTLVKNDQTLNVGNNRSVTVGAAETITVALARSTRVGAVDSLLVGVDQVTAVGHDQSLSVGASSTTSIASDRRSQVGGSSQDTIAGNRTQVVSGSSSETIGGSASVVVSGQVDETTGGQRAETFADDFFAKHSGHRVIVVGGPDKARSASLHVEGPAQASASQTIDVSSLASLVIHCGKSSIRIEPDKITLTSPTIAFSASKEIQAASPKATVAVAGPLVLGGDSVKVTSSGASVVLDSNATVQGTSVKLGGGGGASAQSNDKPPKVTTIQVNDQNGKPLANQRVVLRKGGDGGDETSVVLDGKGKFIVTGDDSYDVFIPDVIDAKKN